MFSSRDILYGLHKHIPTWGKTTNMERNEYKQLINIVQDMHAQAIRVVTNGQNEEERGRKVRVRHLNKMIRDEA
jgi:hypothetical protein